MESRSLWDRLQHPKASDPQGNPAEIMVLGNSGNQNLGSSVAAYFFAEVVC